MPYSYPPSTPRYTINYLKTTHSVNTTHNQRSLDGTKSWKTTLIFANGSTAGETENLGCTSTQQPQKRLNWHENATVQSKRNGTNSAVYTTNWNSIMLRNENDSSSNSNSNSYMNSWTKPDVVWKQQPEEGVVLQSAITMPTKNFFPTLSLTPTRSSCYPFLYTIHKCPLSDHLTDMSLNCNLAQTTYDMPSGHDRHLGHLGNQTDDMPSGHPDTLLGYWPDDMPSGHPDSFRPFGLLGHLRHPSLLSNLGYLGTISNLNTLDPKPIDTPLHVFIEEEGANIRQIDAQMGLT
jgi:hypothetical protein